MKKSLIALAALAASGCAVATRRRDFDEQLHGNMLRATELGGLDATLYATKAKAPAFMPNDGRGVVLDDTYSFTANPTAADEIRLVRIPAGTRVSGVEIDCTDLDTNGAPTFVFSAGYRPVSSADGALAASTAYFAAAGQTTGQSAGRKVCNFLPITFQQDVWLIITIGTASATFAAGTMTGIVYGAAIGPK